MDPDSITAAILAALTAAGAAGATSGVQDAASDAVKRAYDRLRDRVRGLWCRHWNTDDSDERVKDAEDLVEKFLREPSDSSADLGRLLAEAGAEDDPKLKKRVRDLRSALGASYQQQVSFRNCKGIQYNTEKTKKTFQLNSFS